MSNEAKLIRKQMRNVIKEILPEVLSKEMKEALYKEIVTNLHSRLDAIEKNIKETLTLLDERSKDVSSYLVRQASVPNAAPLKND